MRTATTLAALVLFALAATGLAIEWQANVRVSTDEASGVDYQVPLNNGWGVQSFDFLHDWFSPARPEYVHVVFWYEAANGNNVRYARSSNGGISFPSGDREWISDESNYDDAWTPTIAVYGPHTDTHDVLVAWYDEDNGDYSILRRRNDRQGNLDRWFSRQGVSSNDESDSERPSMATCQRESASPDEYYQHIVWEDLVDAYSSCIWYFRDVFTQGDDEDMGLYTRVRLTNDNGYDDRNPSVAAVLNPGNDSNTVYVVWTDDSVSNNGEVWFLRSTNTGRNWQSKVNLSGTAAYESAVPSIAAYGSYVYVVWQEEHPQTGRFQIMLRRSTNYGQSWLSAECLTDDLMSELDHNEPPECFTPSIACHLSYVYVVCQAGWQTPQEWYTVGFMMSDDYGANWMTEGINTGGTDDQPDLDYGEAGLFPTITVSKGNAQLQNKYINVLYRALDTLGFHQVYYLRGNTIDQMPGSGDGQSAGKVPVRHLSVRPSIVKNSARIDLELALQGQVDLSIYDATGRLVRCLGKGVLPRGWYHTSWDGCDEKRRRQSRGAYLVVLRTESGTLSRRVQLVGK